MRIGIDLDNTIICYDRVFRTIGVERAMLPDLFEGDKQAVRDHIRTLPDGEAQWTMLQAEVYGPRLGEAEPFPDVLDVLSTWRGHGHSLVIVSHKTRYAAADRAQRHDLRRAALDWLHENGVTGHETAPVPVSDIHFADTRETKCLKISDLACDAFVDDLPEVFREPGFPDSVQGILFQAEPAGPIPAGVVHARSWRDVRDAVV